MHFELFTLGLSFLVFGLIVELFAFALDLTTLFVVGSSNCSDATIKLSSSVFHGEEFLKEQQRYSRVFNLT